LHDRGGKEPKIDADPRKNARETTRNDEKRVETRGNDGTAVEAGATLVGPLDTPTI